MASLDKKPFFSIGITTYNRRDMLYECFSSLLLQTFTNFEVIVGNDYTQDELYLDEFGINDERFKIINHRKNIGEVNNMNYLLEQATSEWFVWLADDDLFHPEFLSMVYSNIIDNDKNNVVSIFTNYTASPAVPKNFYANIKSGDVAEYSSDEFITRYIKRKISLIGCYGVMKIDVLKLINGMPSLGESFGPYSDTILPVLLAEYGSIIWIDSPLQFLRTHNESISATSIDFTEYAQAEQDFLYYLKRACADNVINYNKIKYYMSCWFADNERAVLFRNANHSKIYKIFLFMQYQVKVCYPRIGFFYWVPYTRYLIMSVVKTLMARFF